MLFQKKQALPINVQNYIYETYFKLVYKLALSFTRDVCLAEDICQDVFMICFNRYHQLKDPQKTGPWLSTITINTARNFIRRNRKVITIPLEDIGEIEASVEIRPESELERQELRAFLFKEIGQLPVEFQEVLVLKYYHDLTVANIGEILKIPEGTVRSRLHRARQKIKRVLKIQRNFKIQIWGGRKMDNSSTPDDKLEELIKATLKEYIDGQETAPEIKDRVRQNLGLKQKRTASSSRKKFLIGVAAAIICIILGSVILFPGQVNAFSMPLFKRFGYFINNKVYNISETYRPDSSQKLPSAPPPENEIDSSLYKKVENAKKNLPFDLRIPQYLPVGLKLADVRIEGEKSVMQATLECEGEGKNIKIVQRGISTNSSTGISYDVEDAVVKNITIGDFPATLFLMKNERVMICWREEGIFYKLLGNTSESETIKIANNLSK